MKNRGFIPFAFDDRDHVDDILDAVQGDTTQVTRRNSTVIASAAIPIILQKATGGERWAFRVASVLMLEGLRRYVVERDRLRTNSVVLAATGEVVELSEHYGVRAVDARGVQLPFWVRPRWWKLPRTQLRQMVGSWRSQRTRLTRKILAVEPALQLLDRHPNAVDALEACAREGANPQVYGIREVS